MNYSLALFARRAVAVAHTPSTSRLVGQALSTAVTALPATTTTETSTAAPRRFLSSSTVKEHVPPEDYRDGHLLTDHLEYMEDMLDVTLRMEQSMKELQDVYDAKRQALADMSELVELEALFEKSANQKALLSSQIQELKAVLKNAYGFASDAPDGTPDAEIREGVEEVNRIIDDASKLEDADGILKQRAMDRAVRTDRARDPEHDW
jgi:hypothetical protein